MIEVYLKYDNMHTIRTINAFICINNHVNSCINSMLSPYSITLKIKLLYFFIYLPTSLYSLHLFIYINQVDSFHGYVHGLLT